MFDKRSEFRMAETWSSVFRRAFADSWGRVSLLYFGAFYWFWIDMRAMVPAFCNITEPCILTLRQMSQQHSCYHLMSSRWLNLNPWGVPRWNETTLGPSRSRPMYLCIWKNVPGHHPSTVHWTCCRQQQLAVLERLNVDGLTTRAPSRSTFPKYILD